VAIRSFYTMMSLLAAGSDPVSLRADAITGVRQPTQAAGTNGVFFSQGSVIVVEDSRYTITLDGDAVTGGGTVSCGAATDEPLTVGMKVWVSQARDGTYMIHGSVKP